MPCAFLAGLNLFTRDSNYWADEIASIEDAPAAVRPPANSVWPFAFAFGAAVLAVGLVTYQAVFVIGIVLLLVSGAEWTAEAWAQRASADAGHNAEVRDRIANPLEFPLAAAIGIGVVVYAFSRVMLFLSKTNTVIAFAVLGSIIIALAFFFAYRPRVPSKAAAVVIGVGALGLIAGGAAAGLSGERDIHPHETTSGLSEEGADICTSPEEFEADENASQSVAASAAVAATITLGSDGALTYSLNGPSATGAAGITLPRSSPNNILFRNQSGEARRLSAGLGTVVAEGTRGSSASLRVHHARRRRWRAEHHLECGTPQCHFARRLLVLRARCRVGPTEFDCAVSNPRSKRPALESSATVSPMNRRVRIAAALGLALLVAGCAEDAPQDMWQPAGPNAQSIYDLSVPVFAIAGVIGVIVMVLIAIIVVKFRDRGQAIPDQMHGKPTLEIILTIIPALILIGVAIPTVGTIMALNDTSDTECIINVTGQQWWWEIDYPTQEGCGAGIDEPIITSGQMVIPVGTPVLVRGTSRDVIHSWWIPRLNGKRDMVPGRVHTQPHRGRRARHLRRPVHRVLRSLARQHAHGSRRDDPRGLRGLEAQPDRALRVARRRTRSPPPASRRSSRSAPAATR